MITQISKTISKEEQYVHDNLVIAIISKGKIYQVQKTDELEKNRLLAVELSSFRGFNSYY